MDKCAVVIGIDRNYVEPACTMLRSMAANTSLRRIDVRVLHDDLDSAAITRLRDQRPDVIDLVPISVRGPGLSVDEGSYISAATYLKLIAAEECREFDRIVVLDVDLLVLGDVRELFEVDLHDAVLAAVQDAFNPTLSSPFGFPAGPPEGVADDSPYFNSGVMVIDVRSWLAGQTTEQAIEFARDRSKIEIWEQDALNGVLIGRWVPLDPRWNCFPISELARHQRVRAMCSTNRVPLRRLHDIQAQAKILHFVGRDKPWLDAYPDRPNRRLYRSF
jgi:lipopolysaccharide biosynthesis glycosyltransferase